MCIDNQKFVVLGSIGSVSCLRNSWSFSSAFKTICPFWHVTRHWMGFIHNYLIVHNTSEFQMSLQMCRPYLMEYLRVRVPCWVLCCIQCTPRPLPFRRWYCKISWSVLSLLCWGYTVTLFYLFKRHRLHEYWSTCKSANINITTLFECRCLSAHKR